MARKKLQVRMVSYGIYSDFDRDSKQLPDIEDFTVDIPAIEGIEFGYILNIKGGRGQKLDFVIEHPPFRDKTGRIAPAFTGEIYIRNSDYKFFLGDSLWAPIEDKVGAWRMQTYARGSIIADKTFKVGTTCIV